MQLGVIGLGRMGANIVRRLLRRGHDCVVHDVQRAAMEALAQVGATPAPTLDALVSQLTPPRAFWMMVPASAVEATIAALAPLLRPEDILIDGGNSNFQDDRRRAAAVSTRGIHYVDVGTSGGVWGLDEGFCMMIGGKEAIVRRLDPIFAALAPGAAAAPRTPARRTMPGSTAERGYLYCGPSGAGHLVKMVHNGIEYGLMEAYAEGLNLLRHANKGSASRQSDAETAPLTDPEDYRYELDLAAVAEVWRRGSVVRSWLLDLIADALARDPALKDFQGIVADSGEGRWTVKAAIDVSVPTPVLSTALFARFASRGEDDFADRLLSAMRQEFGGHAERTEATK